jgi:sulfonate transport system permease protein
MAGTLVRRLGVSIPTGLTALQRVGVGFFALVLATVLVSVTLRLTGLFPLDLPWSTIADATLHTVCRVLLGLVIGILLGTPIGILMGLVPTLDRLLGSVVHPLRQVPLFGWIPLIGLWAGLGEASKVVFVALGVAYVMVVAGNQGARAIPPRLAEMAGMLGLSWARRLLVLVLPASALSILAGIRIALAVAWGAAVGAEILMSSAPGLGNLIWGGRETGRFDLVVAGLVVIAVLGGASNAALARAEAATRERLA